MEKQREKELTLARESVIREIYLWEAIRKCALSIFISTLNKDITFDGIVSLLGIRPKESRGLVMFIDVREFGGRVQWP